MTDAEIDPQTDLDLHDIVRAAATESAIVVLDGESVDSAADYRAVLGRLDDISGCALGVRGIVAADGDPREIVVQRLNRDDLVLRLAEENGWIDHPELVAQLNQALTREGATSLFHAYCSRGFGQEVGFCYLPRAVGERIAYLVRLREEHGVFEQFHPAFAGELD